jgi:hypothetical protein
MKRWTWVLLLAAAAPGCVTVPASEDEPLRAAPVEVEEAPPPGVTADQVTDETADKKLQQLQGEVEREMSAPPRPHR